MSPRSNPLSAEERAPISGATGADRVPFGALVLIAALAAVFGYGIYLKSNTPPEPRVETTGALDRGEPRPSTSAGPDRGESGPAAPTASGREEPRAATAPSRRESGPAIVPAVGGPARDAASAREDASPAERPLIPETAAEKPALTASGDGSSSALPPRDGAGSPPRHPGAGAGAPASTPPGSQEPASEGVRIGASRTPPAPATPPSAGRSSPGTTSTTPDSTRSAPSPARPGPAAPRQTADRARQLLAAGRAQEAAGAFRDWLRGQSKSAWTVQIAAVHLDRPGALSAVADREGLFVLPASGTGGLSPVCIGVYASADEARRAARTTASFPGSSGRPFAKSLGSLGAGT